MLLGVEAAYAHDIAVDLNALVGVRSHDLAVLVPGVGRRGVGTCVTAPRQL